MKSLLEQFKTWWAALEDAQRYQIKLGVAVTLVALVAVGFWSSSTSWKTLLANRTYDDLLRAAASLDEAEIPYRISDHGTLDVPVGEIGSARSALGSNDMLPGLNDVGDLKLGLTPRAQEWAFLRAREGDIARMLGGIDGVGAAQVNIVPRKESLFLDDEEPASASVFLRLRPGATIADSQVRAMVNLVANAVEGLAAEHVSVTDDRGTLLAKGEGETNKDAPGELLEYKSRLQRNYEQSVRQALLPVLGTGADFSVTATVDLDLTSRDIVSKTIDTEKQAVLSEQLDESASEKAAQGGVPGVDANLPERSGSKSTGQSNERLASTMNYVYPTVDEVQHLPAGGIQKLSLAVQVNADRVLAIAGDTPGAAEALQEQISEAVNSAVGADATRGDVVSVNFLPFAERDWIEPAAAPALASVANLESIAPSAVAVLALLLVFGFVIRPLMSNITAQAVAEADAKKAQREEAEQEEEEPKGDDLAARLHALVENFESVDSHDLSSLVKQNSTAAAQVLRRWNSA